MAILHRPGAELRRLNPRNNDQLLFDGLPWVTRAQEEHDQFAELLRSRGVEVLLLSDLLTEALEHSGAARMQGVAAAVDARRLGAPLAQELSAYLRGLDPVRLAHVLMAGMTFNELPADTRTDVSLVLRMHHGADFVIEPLPNLVFTRDSSIWIGPRVVIPSLALRARVREASLTDLIYAHHPRFTGVRRAYESRTAPVEGGDVLLLAPASSRSGWASGPLRPVRKRWRAVFLTTSSRTRCWPCRSPRRRAQMHLDTVCTMVDTDTVVMYANIVDTLSAFTIQRTPDGVAISDATPFLEAAAKAMGIDKLRVIDTGLDPVDRRTRAVGRRQQHAGVGARCRRRLRAQRADQRSAAGGGHRSADHRGLRIGHRPWRAPLHVVSRRPRPCSNRTAKVQLATHFPSGALGTCSLAAGKD